MTSSYTTQRVEEGLKPLWEAFCDDTASQAEVEDALEETKDKLYASIDQSIEYGREQEQERMRSVAFDEVYDIADKMWSGTIPVEVQNLIDECNNYAEALSNTTSITKVKEEL